MTDGFVRLPESYWGNHPIEARVDSQVDDDVWRIEFRVRFRHGVSSLVADLWCGIGSDFDSVEQRLRTGRIDVGNGENATVAVQRQVAADIRQVRAYARSCALSASRAQEGDELDLVLWPVPTPVANRYGSYAAAQATVMLPRLHRRGLDIGETRLVARVLAPADGARLDGFGSGSTCCW